MPLFEQDLFGASVRDGLLLCAQDVLDAGCEIAAVVVTGHAPQLTDQVHAVDEDDRVLVFHHLRLRWLGVGPGGDVDADPAAAQTGHDPGDLLRGNQTVGPYALGLPEYDETSAGQSAAEVEPANKVGSPVAGSARQPAVEVIMP